MNTVINHWKLLWENVYHCIKACIIDGKLLFLFHFSVPPIPTHSFSIESLTLVINTYHCLSTKYYLPCFLTKSRLPDVIT